MSEQPHLAIVNPAAGGGRCGKEFPAALARLKAGGLDVDVALTERAGQAVSLVRDAYAQGRRKFIAVGGDGTGYEVINGLFPEAAAQTEGPKASLGFLPMGTGNSFLRDFTEQGAEYSIEALIAGKNRPCDVVRLEHKTGVLHYINILSIGFVADVNGLRARKFKAWGETGYLFAVVTEVAGLASQVFPMRLDEGELDDQPMVFASFSNSRFTGGKMMMAPGADTNDGLVDFVRVGPLGRFNLLRTFPKIFKGTHVHNAAVSQRKVRVVEFSGTEPIDIMIDGEADCVVPTRLEVLPAAIQVQV